MIVKRCFSDAYYYFNPEGFLFKKLHGTSDYHGKLFVLNGSKYLLFPKEKEYLILKSKSFALDVNDYDFNYKESKIYGYLHISNNKNEYEIKKLKSIWELFNLSTYDYLEKVEDNHLYYLFDLIKTFKGLNTAKEKEEFLKKL